MINADTNHDDKGHADGLASGTGGEPVPVGGGGGGPGRGDAHGRSTPLVPLRTGGVVAAIIPTSIEEVFRLATAIAKSGMAPRDMATAEKLTVAILHGLEIGIPPMMAINKIAVVNGRPTLWGDAVPALLLSKGFRIREDIEKGDDQISASCTVIRPNGEQITRTFSDEDAKTAGLWGKPGPWKQYPSRMLQMRARGLAARDGAADVLSGIYITEEMQDVTERPANGDLMPALPISETKRMSSSQAKKEGQGEVFNTLRREVNDATSAEALLKIRADNGPIWDHLPYSWAQLLQADYDDKMGDFGREQ